MMQSIHSNIEHIKQTINEIALQSNRDPAGIKLLAVSKTHPSEIVKKAYDIGLRMFGENKIQEAEQKIEALTELDIQWHLVGPLQSNKAKKAVQLFDFIHTVDRLKIIKALEKEALKEEKKVNILIQVNVGEEPQKSGVPVGEIDTLIIELQQCQMLQCKGFMTVPPYHDDPELVRPYFKQLKQISDQYKNLVYNNEGNWELSMGMTHDYKVAIQEGATIIRLGTAIFGKRIGY